MSGRERPGCARALPVLREGGGRPPTGAPASPPSPQSLRAKQQLSPFTSLWSPQVTQPLPPLLPATAAQLLLVLWTQLSARFSSHLL